MRFGTQVRAVNLEDHPLEWTYASRRYILPVGADGTVIPWELACLYLGNPEAHETVRSARTDQDEVVWLPGRADEIRRLRSWYDNHNCTVAHCGAKDAHHPGVAGIADDTKVFLTPDVQIFDLLTQDRIMMIVDDPHGDTTRPASQTVSEQDALRSIIRTQQDQIDALKASVDLMLPAQEIDTYLTDAPGTPNNPVDLSQAVDDGEKILLDVSTNIVGTSTHPFPDDEVPRDV